MTLTGGDFAADVSGFGPTIVMQHGFFSDQRTFGRMEFWVRSHMTVSDVLAHSTDWTQTYENQASQLHVALRSSPAYVDPKTILIGHSNGGMISRYFGRHPNVANELSGSSYYYQPVPIAGVITIGTPHWGTPLVRYAGSINTLLGLSGIGARFVCWYTHGSGCQQISRITGSTVHNFFSALLAPVPVVHEMQPRSPYHDDFNAQTESFQRFGVQSYSWKRWQLWRFYGDAYCYADSYCSGRTFVKKADRTYHHDISCAIIGLFITRWDMAIGCAGDAAFMKAFDGIYHKYAEPTPVMESENGDGIVPGWSQRYPNIPDQDQYPVHDGPSHVGETSDPKIAAKVEVILNERMAVDRHDVSLGR
jgi:pimeloyl-ACP methyl ester carboxylesterase